MTENEQKYFDGVVEVLRAKGNIGFLDRPKLTRLGTSLGLSVERTLELDGEAKTFLKQERARLAEDERLRKEREAAEAEERRKAEEARIRAEREVAAAEERRRKDEEKRKQAEEAAAAENLRQRRERQLAKSRAKSPQRRQDAVPADKPAGNSVESDTKSQLSAGKGHEQQSLKEKGEKSSDNVGCLISLCSAIGCVIAFWTGHWIIGIVLVIVAFMFFLAAMSD